MQILPPPARCDTEAAASPRIRPADGASLWLAVGCFVLLSATSLLSREESSRREDVYLTESAALREVFPEARRIEAASVVLTEPEKKRLEKTLRRRLFEKRIVVYRGLTEDNGLCGYAVITEEIGKFQPITFIVACTAEAKVTDVAVMVYRETIGSEVRRRRFLSQFLGKKPSDRLRLHRDVIHVAGATYSCRAITRGVRKVIHAVHELLIGDGRRSRLEWNTVELDKAENKLSRDVPHRSAHFLMGTVLELTCYGEEELVRAGRRAALGEIGRLEELLSTYRPQSEISSVNRDAAHGPVRVSPETFECVDRALSFARRTGGAFDPTLTKNGHEAVELNREASTIRFARPGLRLDLGGVGKGYALDRAAQVLERHGVRRALLNFGGQVLALDAPPDAPGWIVAVRDPRHVGRALGCYEIARASVSTSAAYERGQHVVDPRSGRPAETVLSVTVCAATATEADALSTALDVLGPAAAPKLVAGVEKGSLLVVDRNGEVLALDSPGGPSFCPLPTLAWRGGAMTRYHQVPGFSLADTSLSTRLLVTLFLVTVLGGLAVALLQYHDRVGLGTQSAVEWIEGNEEDIEAREIKAPKTYRELLAMTHDHAFSLPVLLFVLLHLVGLSRLTERLKILLYLVAFLSLVGSLAGPWLIAYGGRSWSIVLLVCGASLSLTMAASSLWSLCELWRRAPRRARGE